MTNSGGPPPGQFMDHEDETWEAALRNNMLGHIDMARKVIPAMIDANWGRIVNVTSGTVALGSANYLHYITSKSAMRLPNYVLILTANIGRPVMPTAPIPLRL